VGILLLMSSERRWERKTLALTGLAAGISMVLRFDNVTVVGFVGLCVLLCSGKARWSRTACYLLGALPPLVPWVLYSVLRFGAPWISDNSGTLTLVDITVPQRFFLPEETAATLFTDPGAWFQALGGRFYTVLLLLALTFVSTQVLLPALLLAAGAVRGKLAGRRGPRGSALGLPVLILVFYGLKTLAYCLVGYATARYHAETVGMVVLALSCLLAPYVGRRTARWAVGGYLALALWAGVVYSTPLSRTVPALCTHPSYAGVVSLGYQEQDGSWRGLWERLSGQAILTEGTAHGPDWVVQLAALVDEEDARVFFLSSNGDPYAYGAYTGQRTFAYIANLNQARCLYLWEHEIKPTHLVLSSENDLPWVEVLDETFGLTYLGQVGENLVYRVG
jgi:hypothetical protein